MARRGTRGAGTGAKEPVAELISSADPQRRGTEPPAPVVYKRVMFVIGTAVIKDTNNK